jgi:Protein of unknown function (DUF1186)/SEC-C motif
MESNQLEFDAAIEAISTYDGYFPRSSIQRAIDIGKPLQPSLLALVERIVSNASSDVSDSDWQAFTIAIYILAKLRAKEAFTLLISACQLPEEKSEELFGDDITERLSQYLGSTFDGDFQALRQIVVDPEIDEFIRCAAIRTHLVLCRNDVMTKDHLVSIYKSFFTDLRDDDTYALTSLIRCAVDIHATELLPDIRNAFATNRVETWVINQNNVERSFLSTVESAEIRFKNNPHNQFIDDPIKAIERWACWKDNQEKRLAKQSELKLPNTAKSSQTLLWSGNTPCKNPAKDLGRNDQCRCGSGQKYKKCCLGKTTGPTSEMGSML